MIFTAASAAASDQWTVPTQEELSMTSVPQAAGASAVYLYREEKTDDPSFTYSEYVRLKILTEAGRDRANVELKFVSEGYFNYSVNDIAGRTIHPDGTIIPFTGKPYERMIEKSKGFKVKSKVFTLPDVTVGSIIEYRYKLRWDSAAYSSPVWIVQTDVYLRKGYFWWRPLEGFPRTNDERGPLVDVIAYTSILPPDAHVAGLEAHGAAKIFGSGGTAVELNVQDVPPAPVEEYMPPIKSLSYRVMFYYTPYKSPDEFWSGQGLHWSKLQDKFIGPGPVVKAAVQQLVAATDTQEQKLRKIYAAVEQLDNTYYTREHSRTEDKSEKLSETRTTDDVWAHKRGSSEQIAELFVAMARAAGMKAYLMAITDRYNSIFWKDYQSLYQLNFELAIVNVDGKEKQFDPSSRFCPYGQLAWQHSDVHGLRQTDGGVALAATSGKDYHDSKIIRVANLTMDDNGEVVGKIDLRLMGAPALFWRQKVLTEDREAVVQGLKKSVVDVLPTGTEVSLRSIERLEDYEEPITATFDIRGKIGSSTGKRLLIAGDLFETNSMPTFTQEKRELAVMFWYPYTSVDVIRINLPAAFRVESLPIGGSVKLPKMAVYGMTAKTDPKGMTIRRELDVAEVTYLPNEYPQLRSFYNEFEAKDKEPIVLKLVGTSPAEK
jgi:hypothetical protein